METWRITSRLQRSRVSLLRPSSSGLGLRPFTSTPLRPQNSPGLSYQQRNPSSAQTSKSLGDFLSKTSSKPPPYARSVLSSLEPSSAGKLYQDPRQARQQPPLFNLDYEVDHALPVRTGPTAGRSILVTGDVSTAFNKLAMVLTENRVRADMMQQRFHEPGADKRKRLKQFRHRRRFRNAFKKMLDIVHDMRKKGM